MTTCSHSPAIWLTILSFLATLSLQVNINLNMGNSIIATCTNFPPGWCCKNPSPPQLGSRASQVGLGHYRDYPLAVSYEHLQARHLAALFMPWNERFDCDHTPPVKTRSGPGSFVITINRNVGEGGPPEWISGASYIQLPNKVPETVSESEKMALQGLLGLRSAGKSWTAPGVTLKSEFGFRKSFRRDIFGGQRGDAYIGPPRQSRFPDVITVNGTDYRSTNTSLLEFRNADGDLLHASELGF